MKNDLVTTQRLAEILGITERRVQQMASENTFNKISRGKFHLSESVQKYISYQLEIERRKFNKNEMQINEARRRKEQAEAFLKEMELDKRRGELLEKEDVIQVWQKILVILKTRLLGMPSKISPQLIGMDSINQIKVKLDEEIYRVLNEISDPGSFE